VTARSPVAYRVEFARGVIALTLGVAMVVQPLHRRLGTNSGSTATSDESLPASWLIPEWARTDHAAFADGADHGYRYASRVDASQPHTSSRSDKTALPLTALSRF